MEIYVAVSLAVAAFWALSGTNAQARLARQRMLGDADPLIATAGRLWYPGPRWLMTPGRRLRREEAEAKLRPDTVRLQHYERLCQELHAWNALESSVALAISAALVAVVMSVIE